MDIRVLCECGAAIVVSQGAAGTKHLCGCGRTVAIPSLRREQQLSASPAFPPPTGLAASVGEGVTAIQCDVIGHGPG
jgi:hypothetical protein